jgi:hypothetical protein
MQNVFLMVGGAALFAVGVAVGTGTQDEKKKPEAAKPAAEQDGGAMPNLPQLPEHKMLAKGAGKWKAAVTANFGPEPMKTTAVETVRSDVGGLWQIGDFVADKNGPMAGFVGHGFVGYDPDRKKFVGSWIDSWTYAPQTMSGTLDATGKILTMDAVGWDSQSKMEMKTKQITTYVDDDHHTFSMRMAGPDGKEMEVLRIEYTREK